MKRFWKWNQKHDNRNILSILFKKSDEPWWWTGSQFPLWKDHLGSGWIKSLPRKPWCLSDSSALTRFCRYSCQETGPGCRVGCVCRSWYRIFVSFLSVAWCHPWTKWAACEILASSGQHRSADCVRWRAAGWLRYLILSTIHIYRRLSHRL